MRRGACACCGGIAISSGRAAQTAPAIAITGLTKRYGALLAVDDVGFEVGDGDFFGLLGPNGAGKTTTINAIVGLARSDAGSIAIFGHDTERDWRAARPFIGLAPQEYNFDRYLSIRDCLIYQAGYYGQRGRAVGARADALLERFGLSDKANQSYIRLSGGMKRRLSLARALVHEPRLLILDEPTSGVDLELRFELWSFLRELNAAGTTIVLTTHYIEEAEALCRTVGIIERGRLVALEPTAALVANHGATAVRIAVGGHPGALAENLAARGAQLDAAGRIVFTNLPPAELGAVLAAVAAAGLTITDVTLERPTLQAVFLELTRR